MKAIVVVIVVETRSEEDGEAVAGVEVEVQGKTREGGETTKRRHPERKERERLLNDTRWYIIALLYEISEPRIFWPRRI